MTTILFDDDVFPAYDLNFLGGMPAGLTYTNSSTTRTYFGSDGLLKTASANEPIFEYNPATLAMLGMRWEMEQRTNLLIQSVFPGSGVAPTSWSGGTGGTSGPASSVYGNADGAQAWTQTATAQRPFLSQSASVSADTTYTLSVLIESVSGSITAENMIGAVSLPAGATVSYPVCSANPSGGGAGTLTAGVLEHRIAIAGTAGTPTIRVGLGVSANATGTVKFSRPQFEAGASRSSFIPTTTASVIRQPDVLTASSISPWYNQSEGTVVFEGIASDFIKSGDARGPFAFHDGTSNNAIVTYFSTTGSLTGQVILGGVNQYTGTTANTTSIGVIHRILFAYKTNNFGMVMSGGTVKEDASGTIPTITQLRLGAANSAGATSFMGYARRFQYFNTRLPNSQIQGMSRV